MFIMSLKLNKTKIAAFVMIFALLAALLLLIAPDNGLLSGAKEAVVKNNQDRVKFITSFGWHIKDEPVEIEEVLIPTIFDEVYERYNALQKENGYDLAEYKGKRIKRYTYELLSYPDKPEESVKANLLVYNNRIIGGDISSRSLSGFMHGFANPMSSPQQSSSGDSETSSQFVESQGHVSKSS